MGGGPSNADTLLGVSIKCLYSDTMVVSALPFIPSQLFLGFISWLLVNIVFYIFTELLLLQDSNHVLLCIYLLWLLFGIFDQTSVPAVNLAELSLCDTSDLGWMCALE